MRLSSHKQRSGETELPMTSMIDVVFLLLIFFMVTTSWHQAERELDPGIQVRESAGDAAARDLEPALVEVRRAPSGPVFRLAGRDFEDAQALTDVLRQFPNKTEGAVVLVSDAVEFDAAATAIQACKSADFRAVTYMPAGDL
ncbi:MAG: biopolymer transporter ExbD [Planctomycetes bacterium]|nr:biopolymer transporter ExbD [Planctomycetota bacterium]